MHVRLSKIRFYLSEKEGVDLVGVLKKLCVRILSCFQKEMMVQEDPIELKKMMT